MKLTKGVVDALEANAQDRVVWDGELKRFGVRIKPSGAKSWVVQYRAAGRSHRMTLAPVGVLTAEKARRRALAILGKVAEGANPATERVQQQAEAVTVRDLCRRHLESGQGAKKSRVAAATVRKRKYSLGHVVKALGSKRLGELRRQDFVRLRADLAARVGPIAANRALGAFVVAWSWGQNHGHVDEDKACPASKAGREPERRDRGQALTAEELARVGAALAPCEGPEADALRVYLLSGARPGEILTARWGDVHQDGRRLRLPEAKTGPRTVYLGSVPAGIIAAQPGEREASAPIFASRHQRNSGGRLSSLNHLWRRVKRAAELDTSVRLYDAGRHTYCTRAYELGYAEHVVRKLTGHAESDIGGAHARYRHVSPARLLEAADAVSASLWSELQSQSSPSAEVTR